MRASIIGVRENSPTSSLLKVHEVFLSAVQSKGKANEGNMFISPDGEEAIAFVGIGSESDGFKHAENIRQACARGYGLLKSLKPESIKVDTMGNPQAAAEGVTLASYSFDVKSSAEEKPEPISFEPLQSLGEGDLQHWKRGVSLATAQNIARKLSDTPANLMTPTVVCEQTKALIEAYNLPIEMRVYEEAEIANLRMGCFLGVAKGSSQPPKLLTLKYLGRRESSEIDLTVVGKGITFDAGGICLKPSKGMPDMKHDMGGAAAAISTIIGAAMTGIAKNVAVITPLCENLINGAALKPGDVIISMAGLTVLVEDTDAEGRLILADGLHFAQEQFKPKTLIDVATLTGAMCIAVGPFASGVHSNSDALWRALEGSSASSGDKAWRMPLYEEYDEMIKCDIADVKNLSGIRDGGANFAARFLSKFVKAGQEWAHIDMAPVMTASSYYGAKNRATGRPVRLLLDYLHSQQ